VHKEDFLFYNDLIFKELIDLGLCVCPAGAHYVYNPFPGISSLAINHNPYGIKIKEQLVSIC